VLVGASVRPSWDASPDLRLTNFSQVALLDAIMA